MPNALAPYRTAIEPGWIDYNGHLRDAYYGLIVSYAIDDLMQQLGLDAAYRAGSHCTLYTLEAYIRYLHEVQGADEISVVTSILDFDRKRMHLGCRLTCARLADAAATSELLLLHVRQGDKPASAGFPDALLARLQALKDANASGTAFVPGSRKIELKHR